MEKPWVQKHVSWVPIVTHWNYSKQALSSSTRGSRRFGRGNLQRLLESNLKIVTTKADKERSDQATVLGTSAFIQKSFTVRTLQKQLYKMLAGVQTRQPEIILSFWPGRILSPGSILFSS